MLNKAFLNDRCSQYIHPPGFGLSAGDRPGSALNKKAGFASTSIKMLSTLALIFAFVAQPPSAPAQPTELTEGKWKFIEVPDSPYQSARPVRWREHPLGLVEPMTHDVFKNPKDYACFHNNSSAYPEIRDTFGVHAALLPLRMKLTDESQFEERGTVFLMGRGYQIASGSPPLNRVSFNSFLLWRHPWQGSGQTRNAFGFAGYTRDAVTNESQESSLYISSSNLFCSGHVLLGDGRLMVVGGTYIEPGSGSQPAHGLRSLFAFCLEDWRHKADQETSAQGGWEGTPYDPQLPPYYPTMPEMNEKRWYSTPLLLQNGKVLIVGGIDKTSGSTQCNEQSDPTTKRYTTTYQLYNPVSNQIELTKPFNTASCTGQNSEAFQLFDDHRRVLGDEYPRLHLASYMKDTAIASKTVYAGPFRPSFLLNTDDCDPNDWLWKAKDHTAEPNRFGGASVLMPRIGPGTLNPSSASLQVLSQVMRVGGTDHDENERDPWTGGDFASLFTYSHSASSQEHQVAISRQMMASYERTGGKHASAVLLPNGAVFVAGGTLKPNEGDCWDGGQPLPVRLYADWLNPGASDSDWTTVPWAALDDLPDSDIDAAYQNENPNVGKGTPDGARMYHSAMIPLPDGTVLATGTDMDGLYDQGIPGYPHRSVRNLYPTIYVPPYLYKQDGNQAVRINDATDRPKITDTAMPNNETAYYGQAIEVGRFVPSGRALRSVHLLRPSTATHSVNFDQRLVRCYFEDDDEEDKVEITMPWDPQIAPPGWYMVFLVDSQGVPSIAKWVQLIPDPLLEEPCEAQSEMEFYLEGSEGEGEETNEELIDLPIAREIYMAPIRVEIRGCDDGRLCGVYRLSVDGLEPGGFVRSRLHAGLAPGMYDFYVRPQEGYLGKRFAAEVARGGIVRASLLSGDVNGDNRVDADDVAAMTAQTGQRSDRRAGQRLSGDLNKDGQANEADMEILLRNLGRQGD
ncbi:MAG: DUF1929 domain-containing protein [Armatimonadetes bacterium]|nr:DUF1929 domain-containing protein [Armatimonadota bacterium]